MQLALDLFDKPSFQNVSLTRNWIPAKQGGGEIKGQVAGPQPLILASPEGQSPQVKSRRLASPNHPYHKIRWIRPEYRLSMGELFMSSRYYQFHVMYGIILPIPEAIHAVDGVIHLSKHRQECHITQRSNRSVLRTGLVRF
ncbi:hypothetical protein CIHG_07060 [Coccidioides immitis H538.4]|uniref:Uncharacterized protein n=1 Tax=Coccidioides immitis H538.4 TaxID=396776 RepID=A0A0J8UNS0_COCIT|nr:hypothetical protein CIHG_07060 [Coccidioides immitis H538.4]